MTGLIIFVHVVINDGRGDLPLGWVLLAAVADCAFITIDSVI